MEQNRKQALAEEKLARAIKFFQKLENKLSKGEIVKKGTEAILVLSAKDYATGFRDLQYNACSKVYKLFKASPRRYPTVAEKIKGMLRSVSRQFFSLKEPQLKLNF